MTSYLCFLCHNDVNSATNEELREKYKDIVGLHLCMESHLCYICTQILKKVAAFKSICVKQSLEYRVLFSEKSATNYQKTETDLIIICPEDGCNYSSRNIINYYYNKPYNDNDKFNDASNEYAELEDESSVDDNNDRIDYTDFDFNHDKTDNLFDNVSYNFNDETNILNENYYFNQMFNQEMNNYSTNAVNNDNESENESNNDYSIPNYNDDNDLTNDNNQFDHDVTNDMHNESNSNINCETYNEETNNYNDNVNIGETNEEHFEKQEVNQHSEEVIKVKKKKKHKKSKKRSYEKIVLSYKEQKAVLEAQRKGKKYLEAEFKCFSCALGFLFKDTYQSHMMRHEESNGQFSCSTCGLRFATQNAKCMHVILHSEIYKCNKCGMEVKRPHRARHAGACGGAGAGAAASCHLCGKAFKDGNCLQQHLKRFHAAKTSKRTYSCNVCGKTYGEQSAVRTHMIKHINHRFDCPQCKSSFASPYTLAQHLKTHAKDPYTAIQTEEYNCMTCGTSYRSRKSLLAHFRNTLAHQQTSFECPICSRNCPNPRALTTHMESHSANKRKSSSTKKPTEGAARSGAVCHLCGAIFKAKNKLTRHLKEVCERARLEEAMTTFYEQTDMQI